MNEDNKSGLNSAPKKRKLPSVLSKMKTIQEVHAYYQKIISCMPNNVYWLDKNCITQGCNSNVLKFVGLTSFDEFIGINYEKMGEIAIRNIKSANTFYDLSLHEEMKLDRRE